MSSSTTTTKTTTKTVTITKKTNFYDDKYFQDSWNDYDEAMKNTIQKFEKDDTPKIDYTNRNQCTDVYRKIRNENIEKDMYKSQALQVAEKDDRYQYVMDVKDFNPNELQVKVIGNKITIDGKFERTTPEGAYSTKSFHKEFTLLSNADMENVTTAVSKDGVLTIKIPKKGGTPGAITSTTKKTDDSTQKTQQTQQTQQTKKTQQTQQTVAKQPGQGSPAPQQPPQQQQQQQQTSTTTTKTTKTVTITKREPFYDDEYFQDNWDDFDSAVKQTIQKFETDSTPKVDYNNRKECTDTYRKIRTENIEKDMYKSQAVQVTEKDDRYQYVMDVKDFSPNDLQVKVIGNKITVDGKFEKTTPDGKWSTKSFHKEFTLLSNADMEKVSTAVSKDGVLTIRIPKKDAVPSGAITPTPSDAQPLPTTIDDSTTQQTQQIQQTKNIQQTQQTQQVQETQQTQEILQTQQIKQTQQIQETETQEESQPTPVASPAPQQPQQPTPDASPAPKQPTPVVTPAPQQPQQPQPDASPAPQQPPPQQQKEHSSTTTTTTKKTVTITKREPFYDDDYFEDTWDDYDNAVKNTIQNFETDSTPKVDYTNRNECTDVYRKIRTENIDKDVYKSQALQVTEKDDRYQYVMDVKDFSPDDLQIKVIGNKITIDGKFEKTTPDGKWSSKSFHKEFTLLSNADMENVTTALSKDGVLTIRIPKKDAVPSGAIQSPTPETPAQKQITDTKITDDSTSQTVQEVQKQQPQETQPSQTELTDQTQIIQQTQETEQVQKVQQTQETEQIQKVQQTQETEQVQKVQQTQETEQVQNVQQTQETEQVQKVQQTQETEQVQKVQQTQQTEQVQKVQQTQETEQVQKVQQTQETEQVQNVQQTQETEQVQPTQETEPVQPTQETEQVQKVQQTQQTEQVQKIQQTQETRVTEQTQQETVKKQTQDTQDTSVVSPVPQPQSTPQPLPQQTQPQEKPQEPQPQPIQPQQPEPQQVQPQQLQPQQTQPQQTQPHQPQAPQPQAPQPLAQQPQPPQPQQPQPGQQQQQQQSTTTTKTTKTVTITKREPFYDDQYFEDTWDDFDSAVKETIQKFETDSTPKIDYNNRNTCTDVYRKIRTDNIEKDIYKSQALQATEKDDKFQYVMDVKDFSPNDLQVKVIENKVTVDGKFEKTTPDGAFSSKSFHKEFTLPSTAKLDQITTALSKDGVLTIKIPKSVEGTPISSPSSAVTPSTQQTSTVQQNISSTQDTSSKKTSVQQSTVQQTSSVRDSSTQQTAVEQAIRDTSTVTSAPQQQSSNVAKITKTTKTVTINKRDPFYDDSFFADNWGDFDNAMKKTIQKFETEMTPKIDFGNRNACTDVYRKIRTNNIEKDLYASQALDVAIKDGKFQCVMDVKDFNPNDLQVKVVEFKVVVDGKFEKTTESGSFTSKSFHKEFTLPNVADMEKVSTALSKDGVLTIKAPIKEGASVSPSGALSSTQQTSSVQQSSTSSQDGSTRSSSVHQQQSSKTEKSSFSSTSTFSSTKKSSMTSSSSFDAVEEGRSSIRDNKQDRLVFTHDNVNFKLPGHK